MTAAFAPIVSEPDIRAAQKTELVHGQDFDVHARQAGWLFGQGRPLLSNSLRSGYVGWVEAHCVAPVTDESPMPTHRICSVSAPVFVKPDLKTHIVQSLPLGSRVTIRAEVGDYAQIGSGAWLHRLHIRPVDANEADWVAVARRYLGQPYVWGGNGARGLDCSGLVQMSLDACGIDAPRDADMQEAALGDTVAVPDEAGDLLFWKGHVGIVSVPGRLLHANATHMGVVEESLEEAIARIAAAGTPLRTVKRIAKPAK